MRKPGEVIVWDLPIRLFHWSLLPLLGFSWWSGEAGGLWLRYHFWSGRVVLALVLFRLVWGLIGSEHARFANFLRGPGAVIRSLRELFRRPEEPPPPGHNPAGGWAVVAMLLVLLVQAVTGLFANDDLFNEGPLYAKVGKATSDLLTHWHHLGFRLLLGLVALHLLAVAIHTVVRGEPLVRTMVSGRRAVVGKPPALRSGLLAAGLFAVIALAAGWLTTP